MEFKKKEYDGPKNVWLVMAKGFDANGDPTRETVYAGASEGVAMRCAMEAMMLSNVFKYEKRLADRGASYAAMLAGAGLKRSFERDGAKPFAWAAGHPWSMSMADDGGWLELEISGAAVSWIDKNGAETEVEVSLDAQDKGVLSRVPSGCRGMGDNQATREMAGMLMTLLDEWELAKSAQKADRKRRPGAAPAL